MIVMIVIIMIITLMKINDNNKYSNSNYCSKISFHYFRALRATFEKCHHKTKRIVTKIIIVIFHLLIRMVL